MESKKTSWFALFYLVWLNLSTTGIFILKPNISMVELQLVAQFCALIPLVLYFVRTKKKPRQVLRLKGMTKTNWLFVLSISILAFPLAQVFAYVGTMFFPYNVVDVAFAKMESAGFLWVFLVSAILPAFVEEFYFRGVIHSGYRGLGILRSGVCSALLFGLTHLNFLQCFYAFFLGCLFAFLVERTDSIWAGVLPHFCINAFSTMIAFITPESPAMKVAETCLFVVFFLLPALPALVFYFARYNQRPQQFALPRTAFGDEVEGELLALEKPKPQERFLSIPVVLIIGLFLAYCLLLQQ